MRLARLLLKASNYILVFLGLFLSWRIFDQFFTTGEISIYYSLIVALYTPLMVLVNFVQIIVNYRSNRRKKSRKRVGEEA